MWLGKLKFNPPRREAFIEDEGDGWEVTLLEDGRQVGGGFFPIDGFDDDAYQAAADVAEAWRSGGGWGGALPM